MELLLIVLLLIALDMAAVRWGHDSTEAVDSPEWERRAGHPCIRKM